VSRVQHRFDLGAHVGFFTLLASLFVGDQGRVVAFEPNPENIRYLKKSLKRPVNYPYLPVNVSFIFLSQNDLVYI
jgi:FkbM family methyltransferase